MSAALMLAQEPWALPPEAVGRVAFTTARRLYYEPARDRQRRWERDRREQETGPPITTREQFVAVMTGQYGGDPAKWAADWDRFEAETKGV